MPILQTGKFVGNALLSVCDILGKTIPSFYLRWYTKHPDLNPLFSQFVSIIFLGFPCIFLKCVFFSSIYFLAYMLLILSVYFSPSFLRILLDFSVFFHLRIFLVFFKDNFEINTINDKNSVLSVFLLRTKAYWEDIPVVPTDRIFCWTLGDSFPNYPIIIWKDFYWFFGGVSIHYFSTIFEILPRETEV